MAGTRVPNPYRPGFNQPPVVFAGRTDVLDGTREALQVAAYDGRTPRPVVLVGPRGVGKTVTLGEIADLAAEDLAWPTVHVEAKAGGRTLRELCARLQRAEQLLSGQAPEPTGTQRRRGVRVTGGALEAKAFGVGAEIHLERERDDEPADIDLDGVLRAAMQTAVARDAGVVVTLDELQNADPDEVHILAGVLQEEVPEGWPLVVAIAALPTLRTTRGRRRLPTYLERAEWHELAALGRAEALEALAGPARQAGRPMTTDAAEALTAIAGGYPYALQVAGHFAWRASHGSPEITLEHAQQAAPRIRKDLAQLFQGRWDDASPRERDYLRALARLTEDDPAPTGGQVAAELGVAATSVSYLRDRLLKKGTIYADAAGGLHFITPGMAEWVRARAATEGDG
jgi:hypothetical protein